MNGRRNPKLCADKSYNQTATQNSGWLGLDERIGLFASTEIWLRQIGEP